MELVETDRLSQDDHDYIMVLWAQEFKDKLTEYLNKKVEIIKTYNIDPQSAHQHRESSYPIDLYNAHEARRNGYYNLSNEISIDHSRVRYESIASDSEIEMSLVVSIPNDRDTRVNKKFELLGVYTYYRPKDNSYTFTLNYKLDGKESRYEKRIFSKAELNLELKTLLPMIGDMLANETFMSSAVKSKSHLNQTGGVYITEDRGVNRMSFTVYDGLLMRRNSSGQAQMAQQDFNRNKLLQMEIEQKSIKLPDNDYYTWRTSADIVVRDYFGKSFVVQGGGTYRNLGGADNRNYAEISRRYRLKYADYVTEGKMYTVKSGSGDNRTEHTYCDYYLKRKRIIERSVSGTSFDYTYATAVEIYENRTDLKNIGENAKNKFLEYIK